MGFRRAKLLVVIVVCMVVLGCKPVPSREGVKPYETDETAQADLKRIQEYLTANYTRQGKKWHQGPVRITAPAVGNAYKHRTFYYVYSREYPVHDMRDVSLCLSIDQKGTILALDKTIGKHSAIPSFYNNALLKVKDQQSARLAGAAIMCLIRAHGGWLTIAAEDVKVEKTDTGWTCKAVLGKAPPKEKGANNSFRFPQHLYRVVFDQEGKCIETACRYTGPVPVCFGAMFIAIEHMPQVSFPLRKKQGAVILMSTEADGVAENSGLKVGDILYRFHGQPLPLHYPIAWLRQQVVPLKITGGKSRMVTVLRNGAALDVEVTWHHPDKDKE